MSDEGTTEIIRQKRCPTCEGDLLADDMEQCPKCGGNLVRHITVKMTAALTMHASLKMKAKDTAGDVVHKQFGGASFNKSDSTWVHREYAIDKREGTYFEEIRYDNGEIWRKEGPLDDQSIHGPMKSKGKRIK